MDLDKTPKEKTRAKNLWNTLKLIFHVTKKRIGKGKLIVLDLNTLLLKRGKLASVAIAKLHHQDYSAFNCRSQNDVVSKAFVSPRDYEFSCSTTPLFFPKRKKFSSREKENEKEEEAKLMKKVLDVLQRYNAAAADDSGNSTSAPSPVLPGFGPSPAAARQTRVTDSPFLLRDADSEAKINGLYYQVDRDAEAFINRFYKDLKNQKKIAALESPSPCHVAGGATQPPRSFS